jgi:hypothetical protein
VDSLRHAELADASTLVCGSTRAGEFRKQSHRCGIDEACPCDVSLFFRILPRRQAGSKTDRSDLSRKAIDLASLLLASPSAAADYRRAKSSQQTSITWHTNQTNHAHTRCM